MSLRQSWRPFLPFLITGIYRWSPISGQTLWTYNGVREDMSIELPSLNIAASRHGDADIVVDIPAGFDNTLGRDASADITIADPAVSRRHARIYRGVDGVWLEDLGSTNGTYVNEDRITAPYRLQDTDRIKIGHSEAAFHDIVAAPDRTKIIVSPETPPGAAGLDVDDDLRSVAQIFPAAHPRPVLEGTGGDSPGAPVVTDGSGGREANRSVNTRLRQGTFMGVNCATCFSTNHPEAWFCNQCGRQLRPIPSPSAGQTPVLPSSLSDRMGIRSGGMRRQQFHQAMKVRNGGQRVRYNDSLAIPTIMFRAVLLLLLVAAIVASLVILSEGVHRVLGV